MSVLFTISQVINCFWSSLFCDLLCKGYFDMLLYQFCKTIMVGLVYQWPCILFINLYAFCLSTFMHFVYQRLCIFFYRQSCIFLYQRLCILFIDNNAFFYQRLCILFIDNHAFCLSTLCILYWQSCILFINVYAFCLSTIMHFVYQRLCILFIEEYAIFLLTIMHFIYHYLIICLTLFIRRLCPWFIEMSFYQDWKYQLTEWWFELNWLLNQWIVRSFSLSISFSWN